MKTPKIKDQVSVLKGRKTEMEIVNVDFGDKHWKYEIVHRPQAAAAIIKIQNENRYVFIRQFRIPIKAEIIEAVAGCLDGNEFPVECMMREITEETGYTLAEKGTGHAKILYLGKTIASPGYSDEIIHLFYAEVVDNQGLQRPDDDERIEVLYYAFEEFDSIVKQGKVTDAHTLLAWYMYKERMNEL